jgi:photosystem II stability/assembly factor-like uncharacterized protein
MKVLKFGIFVMIVMPVLVLAQGWFVQNSGTNKPLLGVHFADTQNGWIASITNTILHTTDGGQNWVDLEPVPSVNYYAVYFVSAQEGWAVGNSGQIRYTTDGGTTWVDQNSTVSGNLRDIRFIDDDHGWIAGGRAEGFPGPDPTRYILYTSNGGTTWDTQLYESDEFPLHAVHFLDTNIGYAVGELGSIFATTDGGATWTEQVSGTGSELSSVYAVTPDTAWAVGVNGLALVTIDGGTTWDSVYLGTMDHLSEVQFVDVSTGWVSGGDSTHGTVLHTTDGGSTWVMQNTGTTNYLYGLFFTDQNNGWAAGYDGSILHTTTGGTGIEETAYDFSNSLSEVALLQNSPNPFSSATSIRFNLPKAMHVTLVVYNLIGQEVVTLVNDDMRAGEHNVYFDGKNLPNGIYFYRLHSGETIRTRMCVLLK